MLSRRSCLLAFGLGLCCERKAAADSPDSGSQLAPGVVRPLPVQLVPLGKISDETVAQTARGLREHAPVNVTVAPRMALPAGSEASEKGRYRAERILSFLARLELGPGKLLAVTDIDIVTQKGSAPNWGILGLGAIDGRACVLSTFRMKRAWEHGGAPEPLVRERLWKTSVHELGHTLGLEHCPTRGCIMEDGHGTVKTTDRETALCPSCATRFAAAIAAV